MNNMDYAKINELREFPFVKSFLAGQITESTFHEDFNAFLKDQYFRLHFGFVNNEIILYELRTLENALKFPQFTRVLKYNVILWRNLLLSYRFGCQVDILDFSTTRTGTHKYIKAITVLNLPKVQRAKRLFVISAGNYAYALIQAMRDLGIEKEIVIIHGVDADTSILQKLKSKNVKFSLWKLNERVYHSREIILRILYSKKGLAKIQSDENEMAKIFTDNVDVTNFYEGLTVGHPMAMQNFKNSNYIVLYKEVIRKLEEYDYLVCPTGSGELIYAFWNEYMEFPTIQRNKIPQFIGIVPAQAHPLGTKGFHRFENMRNSKAKALATVKFEMQNLLGFSNIKWWSAEDKEFTEANSLAKLAGVNSEISGSAGLVFMDINLRKQYNIHLKPTDKILIVNTGNGHLLK